MYLGSEVVATSKMVGKLAPYVPGKAIEWRLDVAEGMDTSLVSSLCVPQSEGFGMRSVLTRPQLL